jgi:hypothetical protein
MNLYFLLNYERVIRSLLLIIINATAIAATTKAPATKLEIKFANEGVIFNSVFIK